MSDWTSGDEVEDVGSGYTTDTASASDYVADSAGGSEYTTGTDSGSEYTTGTDSGSESTTDTDYGSEYTTATDYGSEYTTDPDYGSEYTTATDYGSEYTTATESGDGQVAIDLSDFPALQLIATAGSGEAWLSAIGADNTGVLTGCDQQKMAVVGSVIAAAGSLAGIAFGGVPGAIIGGVALLGSCFALAAAIDAWADCAAEQDGDTSKAELLRQNAGAIRAESDLLQSMIGG